MLRQLYVRDFGLIEELELELQPGFTALTGETGAGKSLIVGALAAIVGERLGADAIRAGAEKARVEAVFDASDAPHALAALDSAGIEPEDETIIITRELGPMRSRYWINRRPATLSLVREVTRWLVDIHGQHEHQALLDESVHLQFLDEFAGPDALKLREAFEALYDRITDLRGQIADLREAERTRAQREDLLRFQINEIEQAQLSPGEEEELQAERSRLVHIERIREALSAAYQALEGTAESPGALELLGTAQSELEDAARYDEKLAQIAQLVEQAAIAAGEAAGEIESHTELLQFEPGRLEQVEARLAEIQRLKRKYGDSIEEVLAYLDQARAELEQLESAEERIAELERELDQAAAEAAKVAAELSQRRRRAAEKLEDQVTKQLGELGMKRAQFKVELSQQEVPDGLEIAGRRLAFSRRGIDTARFLLSANPGEPLRPLRDVASGGELSRLMLVFKTICARGAEIPTLVFDEIDAGIGGQTGHAVGRKLAELGRRAQVLCVTHLPQIACRADNHIFVDKVVRRGRTVVVIKPLEDKQERVAELARMLGATADEKAAAEHARKMLEQAARERRGQKVKSR